MRVLRPHEIRLLRFKYGLHDGEPEATLSFEYATLNGLDLPHFVALSYVWGDLNDTLPICVSGNTISATRNLHDVLQNLWDSKFDQLIWIDALCINQEDLLERASQVALMGDIYSRALYVLAFLSPLSDSFDLGMDYIAQSAANPDLHYEPSISPHLTVRGFDARDEALRDSIIALFATPWWTRVWTVQEFILAQDVRFQCGQRLMSCKTLQQGIKNLASHERTCCWAERRPEDGYPRGYLDYPSKANSGLTLYTAALRMTNLISILNTDPSEAQDLLGVISLFRTRHCSDARDRVFGLSGLRLQTSKVKDTLPADYTMSTATVYRNLAMMLIEKSQSLDVLSHVLHGPSLQKRTTGLPSWVPDWDGAMESGYHLVYHQRMDRIGLFNSSGDMKPYWKDSSSGFITTQGLQIGLIRETAPGYPFTTSELGGKSLINAWRQLAGLPADLDDLASEAMRSGSQESVFLNTLCGGIVIPPWDVDTAMYVKVYQAWLTWFTHSKPASLPEKVKEAARNFDFLVTNASMGRQFITTEDGHFGFGPELAQKDDHIVILPGGNLPYVLRRYSSSNDNGEAYEFIGDAFIYGAMAGEKVGSLESQLKDIAIV
ncbi:hypothetical protein HG530_013085 [Fusarium avenaceum]|nr:hypothetical protein HG530_013085 [Fusarium avenaceum]